MRKSLRHDHGKPSRLYRPAEPSASIGGYLLCAHGRSLRQEIGRAVFQQLYPNSQPYWGKPEDQILLEPARLNGEKPSFAFDEHPKSINTIKSETISNAVFKLLGLTERANYETVFIGEKYQNQQYFHNIIPNNKGILVNQAETELRFDLNPNEDFLARQLNHAKSAIITDRPINLNLLKQLKPKISFLFYFVNDASGVEFCKSVIGLGIPIMLVSKLPQDKINDLKIHYYDLAKIDKIPEISAEDSARIKSLPIDKLRIKTNKIYTFEQKHFYSTPDYKNDHPCIIPNFKPVTSGSEAELDEVLTDFQFTKLIKVLD